MTFHCHIIFILFLLFIVSYILFPQFVKNHGKPESTTVLSSYYYLVEKKTHYLMTSIREDDDIDEAVHMDEIVVAPVDREALSLVIIILFSRFVKKITEKP